MAVKVRHASNGLLMYHIGVCGDRMIVLGETCDDGNKVKYVANLYVSHMNSRDGCSSTCNLEVGWACTPTCKRMTLPNFVSLFPAICGDSLLKGDEGCAGLSPGSPDEFRCDDGNKTPEDGCSSTCTVEPRWTCPRVGAPCERVPSVCGDSLKELLETWFVEDAY